MKTAGHNLRLRNNNQIPRAATQMANHSNTRPSNIYKTMDNKKESHDMDDVLVNLNIPNKKRGQ